MMAPLMKPRPDERLSYRDLARQNARIAQQLPARALPRLAELEPEMAGVRVEVTFLLDHELRPWVEGSAELFGRLSCKRCFDRFERTLTATFRLCIVIDPALASELGEEVDVLVAETDQVTLAEVVEDELLLALPERLCLTDPCEFAPAFSYPAAEAVVEEPADNPFSVLAALNPAKPGRPD